MKSPFFKEFLTIMKKNNLILTLKRNQQHYKTPNVTFHVEKVISQWLSIPQPSKNKEILH